MPAGEKRTIRASEFGEYNYCSRAWWYRHVARIEPSDAAQYVNLQRGKRAHTRHGKTVSLSATLRTAAITLALCGALALLAAVLFAGR